MTAPDKPGLSNEEFIKKWRQENAEPEMIEDLGGDFLDAFNEALDRLEALIGQGKPTPGQIGAIEEALLTSKSEVAPVRKWEAEDTVGMVLMGEEVEIMDGGAYRISYRHLSPEVQDALNRRKV